MPATPVFNIPYDTGQMPPSGSGMSQRLAQGVEAALIRPYCELAASAATTALTTSTWVKVNLATTVHNDTDYFTVASSVITIVRDGIYDISARGATNSGTSALKGISVKKNGTTSAIAESTSTTGQFAASPGQTHVSLVAGDTIRLCAYSAVAANADATIHVTDFIARLLIRKVQ